MREPKRKTWKGFQGNCEGIPKERFLYAGAEKKNLERFSRQLRRNLQRAIPVCGSRKEKPGKVFKVTAKESPKSDSCMREPKRKTWKGFQGDCEGIPKERFLYAGSRKENQERFSRQLRRNPQRAIPVCREPKRKPGKVFKATAKESPKSDSCMQGAEKKTRKGFQGTFKGSIHMKKLVTGLASYGLSGQAFHYPFLTVNRNIDLKKILIRNASEKNLPAFPDSVEIVSSFKSLTGDPEIELIVVNTPDFLHYEMAKKALLAGKNVVIEKPFTKSLKEAEELLSLADKMGLVITPYQNRRFDGDFLTVKKLIETSVLKGVVDFRSTFSKYSVDINLSKWRERPEGGSGAIYNIGSHLVDQAVSLFGNPEKVLCISEKKRPGTQVDDYMMVYLFYKKITAELRCSYVEKIFSPRFHINALNGSFVKFGIDPQEARLRRGGILPEGDAWGADDEENWGILDVDGKASERYRTANGNYSLFYNNVVNAVRGKEKIEVKPEQVISVLKILELCKESGRTGKVLKFN